MAEAPRRCRLLVNRCVESHSTTQQALAGHAAHMRLKASSKDTTYIHIYIAHFYTTASLRVRFLFDWCGQFDALGMGDGVTSIPTPGPTPNPHSFAVRRTCGFRIDKCMATLCCIVAVNVVLIQLKCARIGSVLDCHTAKKESNSTETNPTVQRGGVNIGRDKKGQLLQAQS